MHDIINLLPDSVANQIAAGEVVQRPASVVKELLENSIDAGATDILLHVYGGGKTGIQVIDNGQGMSPTDARLCFERHATSKIHQAQDLEAIVSMGFRGEALASIAAVAEVLLTTRRAEDEMGTQLSIVGSEFRGQKSCAAPVGSNFLVRNLFFNVPARRRFLKGVSIEIKHIVDEFQRVALANPAVAMRLQHDEAMLYSLSAATRPQRILHLFGARLEKDLMPLEVQTQLVTISGYLGVPRIARKRGGEQFMFVNGRYMRHPYFNRAVFNAYTRLIPPDTTPVFFLFFTIDPQRIDINIHPTKTEIKFQDEGVIWQMLHSAVREVLGQHGGVPPMDFETPPPGALPTFPRHAPLTKEELELHPFDTFPNECPDVFPRPNAMPVLGVRRAGAPSKNLGDSLGAPAALPGDPITLPLPLYNRYIVHLYQGQLILIDQHRAHARILFEQLMAQQLSPATAQQLLFPIPIEVTPGQMAFIDDFISQMRQLGLALKRDQGNRLMLHAVPPSMQVQDPASFIQTLLGYYEQEDQHALGQVTERQRARLALAGAIPPGQPMAASEAAALVSQLFNCHQPALDPLDRPTYMAIQEPLIKKWFAQ